MFWIRKFFKSLIYTIFCLALLIFILFTLAILCSFLFDADSRNYQKVRISSLLQLNKRVSIITSRIEDNPENYYEYLDRPQFTLSYLDKKSLKDYDRAILLHPKRANAYFMKFHWYFAITEFRLLTDKTNNNENCIEKAIENITTGMKLDPDYDREYHLWMRARAFIRNEQYEEAISDLTEAIDGFDIENRSESDIEYYLVSFYRERSYAYKALKQLGKALYDLNKVLELDPFNFDTYSNRAFIFSDMAEHDKALKDYDFLIYHRQAHDSYTFIHYEKAKVFEEAGMIDEALREYKIFANLESDIYIHSLNRDKFKEARERIKALEE